MAQKSDDRSRAGNDPYQKPKKSSVKDWDKEPEKGTDAGQDEYYDPQNDRYVLKSRRLKVTVSGITPEMTDAFLDKIKKKFRELEEFYTVGNDIPVAIRYRLFYPFPASCRKGRYKTPSGVDLLAWSEFIYTGLVGTLYENRTQIVCSGEEVLYSELPGIMVDEFIIGKFDA